MSSPDDRHVYGLGGDIGILARDADTGALTPVGSVPIDLRFFTDFALSPDGTHLYVVGGPSELLVFTRDPVTGGLTETFRLEDGVDGITGIDGPYSVVVSPDGLSVHVAARGSIATFQRDPITGVLTPLQVLFEGVDVPAELTRVLGIVVAPDGASLYTASHANDELGGVLVFQRDVSDGSLTFLENHLHVDGVDDRLEWTSSVAISQDGAHVYAGADEAIVHFARSTTTGALTRLGSVPMHYAGSTVALSPDQRFVVAVAPFVVYLRDETSGALEHVRTDFVIRGLDLLFTADGRDLYVPYYDFPEGIAVYRSVDVSCPRTPQVGCRTSIASGRSSIKVRSDREFDTWTLAQGEETDPAALGDPTTDTAWAVCLYQQIADQDPRRARTILAPASQCGKRPCWRRSSRGTLKWKDPYGLREGVKTLVVKPGNEGKAKVKLRRSGSNIARYVVAPPPEIIAQVANDLGECWESRFTSTTTGTGAKFVAHSD